MKKLQTHTIAIMHIACHTGLAMLITMISVIAGTAAAQSGSSDLVAVKTVQPRTVTLRRSTTQPASVHAFYEVKIFAKVAGYLKQLNADIGDEVKAGQSLAEIDVPEMEKSRERFEAEVVRLKSEKLQYEAAIDVAEAKLGAARASVTAAEAEVTADASEYGRVKSLAASKAVTDRARDEAFNRAAASEAALASRQANYTVGQAELRAARAYALSAEAAVTVAEKQLEELTVRMGYATLRAPFDGVVTTRNVNPGDLVRNAQNSAGAATKALFTVVRIDQVRIRSAVPERDAPWVDVGDEAVFVSTSLRSQIEGRVSRMSKSLDPATRTMVVEFDVPNPDRRLIPGMFGQMTIVLEEHADALVIPAGSLRVGKDGGDKHVYVVEAGNTVRHAKVVTGMDDGHEIEILSGLNGDERVVTGILGRLAPGQKVRVIE